MEQNTVESEALLADGALTLQKAEIEFSISRSQLYAQMNAGSLPFFQFGRRRLIPRKGLCQLVARGTALPPQGEQRP